MEHVRDGLHDEVIKEMQHGVINMYRRKPNTSNTAPHVLEWTLGMVKDV